MDKQKMIALHEWIVRNMPEKDRKIVASKHPNALKKPDMLITANARISQIMTLLIKDDDFQ